MSRRNKNLPQETNRITLRRTPREDVDISIPRDFHMTGQKNEQPDPALKLALVYAGGLTGDFQSSLPTWFASQFN